MPTRGTGFEADVNTSGDGILYGGRAASVNLRLRSTRDSTKGYVMVPTGETLKPETNSAFILPQTGAGAPTHTAPEGQAYWDTTNNVAYVNNSGGSGAGAWTRQAAYSEITSVSPYGSDAAAVGDPDAGASALYARGDHVHGIERGATVGSPTYNSAPYFNTDHHLFGVRANGLYRPLQLLTYVDDDFMTGATSVGFAGREGWTTTAFAAGGSVALVGLSGHPGICKINNQTVSNGGARVRLGDNADNWVLAGDEWFAALIKISGTASSASKFMVGLGNAPASSAADTNAIGFQDNNSTAMRGFCMAASSQSNTGTTFSYSGDTWYWLVAKMNLSLITFYILDNDGDTLWNDTVSTNIPTGDASPTLRFWTTNSTTRDMSVDYFGMGGGIGRSFWRKS